MIIDTKFAADHQANLIVQNNDIQIEGGYAMDFYEYGGAGYDSTVMIINNTLKSNGGGSFYGNQGAATVYGNITE
ncbi:MAG: hypothetical protein ACOYNL_10625 [Rickettsiales bacterium]